MSWSLELELEEVGFSYCLTETVDKGLELELNLLILGDVILLGDRHPYIFFFKLGLVISRGEFNFVAVVNSVYECLSS